MLLITTSEIEQPITNTAWVGARLCKLQKRCTRLAAASDKVYQLLAHGRWFSPGTPASSTTKTGRHDIAEILLKVALNTKNQIKSFKYWTHYKMFYCFLIITYIHCLTKPTFSPTCSYKNYKKLAFLHIVVIKLKASQVGVFVLKMTTDMFRLSKRQSCPILSDSWLITEFVTRL